MTPTGKRAHGVDAPFRDIHNGVPGLAARLPIVFSEGVAKGRIDPTQFVRLTAYNPARLFGLYPRKGELAPGSDADIVVWDPNAEHMISSKTHHMRCDYSMFEGFAVKGNAKIVLSRGEVIVEHGKFQGHTGRGSFLRREARGGAWK